MDHDASCSEVLGRKVRRLRGRRDATRKGASWLKLRCFAFPLHNHLAAHDVLPTMSDNKAEGRRQDALVKQRAQMRQDFERQKQTLINETEKARPSSNRFVGENDSMEESLKKHTVGLVHLEEFQQRRKEIEELKAREAAMTSELKYVSLSNWFEARTGGLQDMECLLRDEQKKAKKRKKAAKAKLSFAMDDDEEGEGSGSNTPGANGDGEEADGEKPAKRSKFRKNPGVDTSFLPDRDREEDDRRERERLRQEWLKRQEDLKHEEIEVTYSFWDGSGHRKSVMVSSPFVDIQTCWLTVRPHCIRQLLTSYGNGLQCKKGDDIGSFLEKARQQFPELRNVTSDNLMYIKVCSLPGFTLYGAYEVWYRRI